MRPVAGLPDRRERHRNGRRHPGQAAAGNDVRAVRSRGPLHGDPVAASTKPVVKQVRKTGFAAYEALTAHNCGVRGGTLIVGIDHDTDSAYQYAFSKFKGAATATTAYGKIPAVFNGLSHVSLTTHYDQLVGE
jgi:hypothetical protein